MCAPWLLCDALAPPAAATAPHVQQRGCHGAWTPRQQASRCLGAASLRQPVCCCLSVPRQHQQQHGPCCLPAHQQQAALHLLVVGRLLLLRGVAGLGHHQQQLGAAGEGLCVKELYWGLIGVALRVDGHLRHADDGRGLQGQVGRQCPAKHRSAGWALSSPELAALPPQKHPSCRACR